jgi:hypothetical protein
MKRNWQSVAERADNHSFGVEEIGNAILPALAGDCRDEVTPEFIDKVRGVFEEQEALLIKDDIRARVEALRPEAGAGIGRRLIENVVRISSAEAADLSSLVKAMVAALAERAARCNRQVEEHYLRESSASRAANVRSRLEQATASAPLDAIARQILKLDNSRPTPSVPKLGGLDEGPSIR